MYNYLPFSMPKSPKTIEEDLHSLNETELLAQTENQKLKRFLFIFGGLLTFLLFLSFTFVTYPIDHIIAGKLESHTPIAHTLLVEDLTIIFEQNTDEQLQTLYLQQQKVEFSICLSGTKEEKTYHITNLYTPQMYQQTFNHVTFEPCNKNALIMLHSHPYKSCLASDTDINTLKKTQTENPNIIMIVMCEPQRFSVYT